jgi:hypothetical protein
MKTGGSTISSLTQSNMTGANTKTIAESDLEVLMMNFSAFEVKTIAYEGVWNVDILKYKIIAALVIAIVALALLTYSAAVQIISGLETYILLYITLMLLVSLYILYDFLRLLAVFKLANLHDDQIVFLAETVAQENARFNIVLKESFHDLGIQDIELQKLDIESLPKGMPKELKEKLIREVREEKKEYVSIYIFRFELKQISLIFI